ncbi:MULTISPECIES: CsbD family protein [Euryhalocaulis]|uniref:CsbD family protein n=1 Tax=Euryhalocaulis TaxID=1712422 RepID=UPI00039F7E0C|nr:MULTISPECIES: CsbD family protein [Euryhalocaulis]MBA4801048.1 CsbD family protein [Euryhalocaulis sp.]
MNTDELQGKWKQLKGSAQAQWGKLTDDDLDWVEGRREQLIGKIQERYGKDREAAREEVDTWLRKA